MLERIKRQRARDCITDKKVGKTGSGRNDNAFPKLFSVLLIQRSGTVQGKSAAQLSKLHTVKCIWTEEQREST